VNSSVPRHAERGPSGLSQYRFPTGPWQALDTCHLVSAPFNRHGPIANRLGGFSHRAGTEWKLDNG
jgi:hypothetical protein